ncbi:DNA polymerase III subunit beta [Fibrisoma montanum]|uniref:Beta sliding clamp n=1 Tax=Fibrisoma montanum TaxID=2305895 RepID=A0A418MB92_9BACT|nr:DNA polymerase III subunit beta [Fibrisoma montanum]RIV23639.1 DNA polymerase III subunit beta [Fibrisoma montanum]
MAKKQPAPQTGPRLVFVGSSLKKALQFCGGAMTPNPLVPVAENVRIVAQNGQATLTGTDMRMTNSVTIDCELMGTSAESLTALLPYALLNSLMSSLTNDPVIVSIDETSYGHTISAKTGTYKMTGENPIDFPRGVKPGSEEPLRLTLSGTERAAFMTGLARTVFAVGTDDLRPAMTGVSLRVTPGVIRLCATDGHRLALTRLPVELATELEIILPAKFTRALLKQLADTGEALPLELAISGNSLSATIQHYRMETLLIDERFPDVENAIPVNQPIEVRFQKEEVADALKRVLLFANRTTWQIRLAISEGTLTISAEDLDYSHEGTEIVDCQLTGDPITIGFNGKLFADCLAHTEGDTVRLKLTSYNRAGLLYGASEHSFALVMPCLLNSIA